MSQTKDSLDWIHQSLIGNGMHLHALTNVMVQKGIFTKNEVTEALTAFSRDDYTFNTRRILEHSEAELREGEWRGGGIRATRELAQAAKINEDSKVLDIGCGMGAPARTLAREIGCHVCGIDKDFGRIVEAIRRNMDIETAKLVEFKWGDGRAIPYPDAKFDVVMGQAAWNWIPDKETLLQECWRVLKQPGIVAFECAAVLDEVGEDVFERMTDEHLRKYRVSGWFRIGSWRDLLRDTGFEDIVVTEMWEDTRRYEPVLGDGREVRDIRDEVNVRVVAQKP